MIGISFDLSLKDPLMLLLFATIGLNANLASFKSEEKRLFIFVFVVVGLLLVQNTVGTLAEMLGL